MHILSLETEKMKTALLESAEGREWPYKVFHDQSPQENVAEPAGSNPQLLITSRTRIQGGVFYFFFFLFLFFRFASKAVRLTFVITIQTETAGVYQTLGIHS